MINLYIRCTNISTANLITLAVGNVESIPVAFNFSEEWDGLIRVAVFCNGKDKTALPLTGDSCNIPREVLSSPGDLFIAVRGIGSNGGFVLCTENKFLGKVLPSLASEIADEHKNSTPDIFDTALSDIENMKHDIANAVFHVAQDLSDKQKAQARQNIGIDSIIGNITDAINSI